MGHSEYDPAAKERRPRTPATRPSDVRTRNRQQAARIGDLVTGGRILSRTIVIQQKTGRPVQFELLEPARGSNSGLARTPRCIAASQPSRALRRHGERRRRRPQSRAEKPVSRIRGTVPLLPGVKGECIRNVSQADGDIVQGDR